MATPLATLCAEFSCRPWKERLLLAFGLPVRTANCLNNANITTVGQLAVKTEADMLKYRNFGKKSLNEIKEKLLQLGLSLGMKFESGLVESPMGGERSDDSKQVSF